jgi:2-amino-4-hydroxy-6-hydroxymethyldihydropteridine diphosphokinase
MAVKAYIGVGSNIAPEEAIVRSFSLIRELVRITAVSTCYWTLPLGGRDMSRFVNCVWEIETDTDARELKYGMLKDIEIRCGRIKSDDKYGPRTIDLDLLLFGNIVIKEIGFTIPHPDIRERPFVAFPLFEIAPGLVLPDTGEPIGAVAASLNREGLVPYAALTELLRKELTNG